MNTLGRRLAVNLFRLKLIFGYLICKVFPGYAVRLLGTWFAPSRRNAIDSYLFDTVFFAWLRFIYLGEKDPDKREQMKIEIMSGTTGVDWAKIYFSKNRLDFNRKLGCMTLGESQPIFAELDELCASLEPGAFICQLGCSAGKEVAYFAARHPQHSFLGTDISEELAIYARSKHSLPNLKFEKILAKDLVSHLSLIKSHTIIVFTCGTLQYLQPEHLQSFFEELQSIPNLQLFVNEPANSAEGDPDTLSTSRWRGNFSFTHNYKNCAEKAGLKTDKVEIVRPYLPKEDYPVHHSTVHYYYRASSQSPHVS